VDDGDSPLGAVLGGAALVVALAALGVAVRGGGRSPLEPSHRRLASVRGLSAEVATTRLIDSVREAPASGDGVRPTTTWREDLTAMIIAVWPITALFFDGRNHNNKTGQESFFSVAHMCCTRHDRLRDLRRDVDQQVPGEVGRQPEPRSFDFKAIPVGYGVSIIGLCILGVAGRRT